MAMTRTDKTEDAINHAIATIAVPDGLQALARANLRRLADEEGVDAVYAKAQTAVARRLRAEAWVARQRAATDVASAASPWDSLAHVGSKNMTELTVMLHNGLLDFAQEKAGSTWARHFLEAHDEFQDWGSLPSVASGALARAAEKLLLAIRSEDFQRESPVIRGALFAETADLVCEHASISDDLSSLEESLVLYRTAVSDLCKVDDPEVKNVIAHVQVNRGHALSCLGKVFDTKILSYKVDFDDVNVSLRSLPAHVASYYDKVGVDVANIERNLTKLREFDSGFNFEKKGNWQSPPVGIPTNNLFFAVGAETDD